MMRRQHPVSQVGLAIRRAVEENPGIHFRGLARAAQVTSAGQLRHHLDRLERQGLVVEVEDGRYKRFFKAGAQDPKLRAEMARFSRTVPRRIAKLLLMGPLNRTQLRRNLGCADSTLGYHLSRMLMLGDLAKVRGPSSCIYSLTSEETVRKMLQIQGALAEPAALEAAATEAPATEVDLPNQLWPSPAPLPAAEPMPAVEPLPAADLSFPDRPNLPEPSTPPEYPEDATSFDDEDHGGAPSPHDPGTFAP